ncbi:hypothetical protein BJF96_g8908 [Verticillium dahliae]|uniref:Uncharacterized protein n=1 Tax=Verticillium dahliae TaxID=27337 RepID=A0AA45AHR1_VERDA|nr:hypothetical protein BJF96_g8908 [Verticillium dahliae]
MSRTRERETDAEGVRLAAMPNRKKMGGKCGQDPAIFCRAM